MTQALITPSLREDSVVNSHAGGVRRYKAGRPARIPARFRESVISATGTGAALLAALLALTSTTALAEDASTDQTAPSKQWPPPVQLLSPSAPLNRKSKISVNLVHQWQEKNVKPTMGARGEVRFIYGATEDTVVCAPLRLCDIALQPGEIVQNVNLGDPLMWSCPPAISGAGAAEITHLMCKPIDAGLNVIMLVPNSMPIPVEKGANRCRRSAGR